MRVIKSEIKIFDYFGEFCCMHFIGTVLANFPFRCWKAFYCLNKTASSHSVEYKNHLLKKKFIQFHLSIHATF